MKRLVCVLFAAAVLITACSPAAQEKEALTLGAVVELAQKKLSLSWQDFEPYEHETQSSQKVVWNFALDEPDYRLSVGGDSLEEPPAYISLYRGTQSIDIRTGDVQAFISAEQQPPAAESESSAAEPEPESSSQPQASPSTPEEPPAAQPAAPTPSAAPQAPAQPTYTATATPTSYDQTAAAVSVTLTNTSGAEGGYGNAYRIEKNVDGSWQALPLEIEVTEEWAILPAGQSSQLTMSLYQEQFAYTPGTYRIVFLDGLNGATCEFSLTGSASPTYSMSATPASYPVAAEQITVTITNTSTVEGGYGLYYKIQRKVEGGWKTVPLEFDVNDIAVILMPGKSSSESFSLHQSQYDYQPGTYRIVLQDGGGNASAQFTLE